MNKIKKLHVGNLAGVSNTLANFEKQQGFISDVCKVNTNMFGYPYDYFFPISCNNKRISNMISIIRVTLLESKYDIIHQHSMIVPFYLDLIIQKLLGKQIIIHYHGTDIRGLKQPFIHKMLTKEFYVSTPDLLQWVPNATWIPNPYIIQMKTPEYVKHDPIRIVHAPSVRANKGTQFIISAINRLQEEGHIIDFKLVENTTHPEALKEMSNSDIVIDSVNSNIKAHGLVSIEAMSLGKPVICCIGNYYDRCPIISADEISIYDVLKQVMEYSEAQLKEIGIAGIKYVDTVHRYEAEQN